MLLNDKFHEKVVGMEKFRQNRIYFFYRTTLDIYKLNSRCERKLLGDLGKVAKL